MRKTCMFKTLDINGSTALRQGAISLCSNGGKARFVLDYGFDTAVKDGRPVMPHLWVPNRSNGLFDYLAAKQLNKGGFIDSLVTLHLNQAFSQDSEKLVGWTSSKDSVCYGNLYKELLAVYHKEFTVEELIKLLVSQGLWIYDSVYRQHRRYVLTVGTSSKARSGNVNLCLDRVVNVIKTFTRLNGHLPTEREYIPSKFAAAEGLIASSSIDTGLRPRICIVPDPATGTGNNAIRYRYKDGSEGVAKDLPDIYTPATIVTGANGDYAVRTISEHKLTKVLVHDGCAHLSLDFDNRLNAALGVTDNTYTGFKQWRMSFMKGGAIGFDIVGYCQKLGITHIQDIYGEWHTVDSIDVLAPETCFKAVSRCFKSIQGYYDALNDTYPAGMGWFRVCNISKAKGKIASLCYLYNQTAEFEKQDALLSIAEPMLDLFKKALGSDIAAVKYLLGLFAQLSEDGEGDSYAENMYQKASEILELDEAFINEPQVRGAIKRLIKEQLKHIQTGSIPVEGNYVYIAPDPGTLYGAPLLTERDVFYMSDAPSNKALVYRSPHISYNETVMATVAEGDYKKSIDIWLKHLNGLLVIDSMSAAPARMGGADFDGDKVLVIFKHEDNVHLSPLFDSYKELPLIVNNIKGTPPIKCPITDGVMVNYAVATMGNRTGQLTNIATFLHSLRGTGRDVSRDIAIMSVIIGAEIDYVKTFERPELPKHLKALLGSKPTWLAVAKGSVNQKTQHITCAMQRLFDEIGTINAQFQNDGLDEFDARSKTNPALAAKLQENHDSMVLIEAKRISSQVLDLSTWYGTQIREIRESVSSRSVSYETASSQYSYIYETAAEAMSRLSDDPRALATAAVEATYNAKASNDSYSFPWVCAYSGLLANLANNIKRDGDRTRTRIVSVNDKFPGKTCNYEGRKIRVQEHESSVPAGLWTVRKFVGRHYMEFKYDLNDSDIDAIIKHHLDCAQTAADKKLIKTGELKIEHKPVGLCLWNIDGTAMKGTPQQYADLLRKVGFVTIKGENIIGKDSKIFPGLTAYVTAPNGAEVYIGSVLTDKRCADLRLHVGEKLKVSDIIAYRNSIKFNIEFRTEVFMTLKEQALNLRNTKAWYHNVDTRKLVDFGIVKWQVDANIDNATAMFTCIITDGRQIAIETWCNDAGEFEVTSCADNTGSKRSMSDALKATVLRCVEHQFAVELIKAIPMVAA